LLYEKKKELGDAANKLISGLDKIIDTRIKVEQMSVKLEENKAKAAQFQKECEDYLVILVSQKREADEQQKSVAAFQIKIQEEEVKCLVIAEAAQKDLDAAIPALNEAMKALESLNKKDIAEVKAYGKPPTLVEVVMEAVMIVRQSEPSWAEAKRQLGEANFIKSLIEFDKDNIPDKVLKKINKYTSEPDFQPEKVGSVSGAAKSLCMWVRAMEMYGNVYRVVQPKRERYNQAMAQLKEKQDALAEAKRKLDEVSVAALVVLF
jgi:dynein heavy chain, axonemal